MIDPIRDKMYNFEDVLYDKVSWHVADAYIITIATNGDTPAIDYID